ncbi:hypothetical protein WMF20_46815 [Sorangium sp. So ce834]|uniref:hypothetical protein n=1 Tax=Sorangium sp. So ce834 TaxID=3133321 RepID=UPI003F64477D
MQKRLWWGRASRDRKRSGSGGGQGGGERARGWQAAPTAGNVCRAPASSTYQTGDPEHVYHGKIAKQGEGQARWMLVQAAQHVGTHPGPLDNFFRRLTKRKNRNVAVVATARKLVTIAYHMLKNNEPYRYAVPRSTDTKLARMRVKATGERCRTGLPKGQPRPKAYGSGERSARTVPALDTIGTRPASAGDNAAGHVHADPSSRPEVDVNRCPELDTFIGGRSAPAGTPSAAAPSVASDDARRCGLHAHVEDRAQHRSGRAGSPAGRRRVFSLTRHRNIVRFSYRRESSSSSMHNHFPRLLQM